MVREFSKLMLRAYNNEAGQAVAAPLRVMAMPVSWDITVERAADSSLQRQP